jgi:triacylglycerol esterase/lipase EstA (alpha/beta hydrolase family)
MTNLSAANYSNNVQPCVILPGYLAGADDYQNLSGALQNLGIPASVVPLRWWEWLPTVGGRSVVPILQRLDAAIQSSMQTHNVSKINLIAHSAGGWLARIYLGDRSYYDQSWSGRSRVSKLITLGTPQDSREPWTRKNLGFVNDNYPGAFHEEVQYICVAGKAIFGQKYRQWLAYSSYELTCGQGDTWGDGIIPITSAHLVGAENLVLEGALHSPRARLWYGSPELLPNWTKYLC